MKPLLGAVVLSFFLSAPLFATISNIVFDNSQPMQPSDSLIIAYESTQDTTYLLLYLDKDGPATLDTLVDQLMYNIMIIDNGTEQMWWDNGGLFPDSDPADHALLFSPGSPDFAAAKYWFTLTDADNAISDSFRIDAIANPYRTISGTITPPSGESAAFISVDAGAKDYNGHASAFTDVNGDYTLYFDSAMVVADSGRIGVQVTSDAFPGYIPDPMGQQVNLLNASQSNIDFSYIAAACAVKGQILSGTDPLSNIWIGLRSASTDQDAGRGNTDSAGNYFMACAADSYEIQLSHDDLLPDYLMPDQIRFRVDQDDTATVDIQITRADTAIYGRITLEGNELSGQKYALQLWSNNGHGTSETECDSLGYFRLPATTLDSLCNINLAVWWKGYDSLPQGYMIDNGNYRQARPGDTVVFNIIPEQQLPRGYISGSVSYSGQFDPDLIGVCLIDPKNMFAGPIMCTQPDTAGNFSFTDVPMGEFLVLGLIDTNNDHTSEAQSFSDSTIKIFGGDSIQGIMLTINDMGSGEAAISGDLSAMGPWPDSTRIYVVAIPADTTLPDSLALSNPLVWLTAKSVTIEGPGPYAIPGLDSGVYYVIANAESLDLNGSSWNQFGHGMYGSIGPGNAYDLFPVVLGSATQVTGIDLVLYREQKNDSVPVGTGLIEGTIEYSGAFSMHNIEVLLFEGNDYFTDPVRSVVPDTDGQYAFINVADGQYTVMAMIDTNQDHSAEAAGINDSLIVIAGSDTFTAIDIVCEDRPAGQASISGAITYAGTVPAGSVISVMAVPVDTLLSDSVNLSDANIALKGVMIRLPGGPDTFTIAGLAAGVYYLASFADSAYWDTSSGKYESREFAMGIYGVIATRDSSGKPDSMVFERVLLGASTHATGINIEIESPDIAVEKVAAKALPSSFALSEPAPNPFNPTVSLKYQVPQATFVSVSVYDISGKLVTQLTGKTHQPGYYQAVWNGTNALGQHVSSGMYVCRMQAGSFVKQQKMVLLK
ncbi:MAG: hypothetical protein A2350_16990 [Candidatus Raymondbacteria bacterium RifOxyB12_full_50_8]|nr:MAG: hypothetical protein A2350_16990 [Candidatus Raymondbacteria bacterium RifOxyB12_full_50_8]